ncbi:hypothetical protein BKA65DRAFT_511994 [Rhexocercosporidium sp. MPI-PUGE-AT-0058]|nr:hypothetical protein BKA65DRAFT_511994 [Rhexocercosporidium sp. MPI-PUGE-AT-0058]
MANQRSLTAAMASLSIVQGSSPSPPTTPRLPQNLPPRTPESSIMGKWEHDRFGMNSNSRANSTFGRGAEQQEKSTVASWRAFAQSNTSKPLPPLRVQNAGNAGDGVWSKEKWRGRGNEGAGPRASGPTLPILPTLPRLPTAPPQGQDQTTSRGLTQPTSSPQHAPTPVVPQAIPRDQALRKRKSDQCLGQSRNSLTEEPLPKRASPDRPSPWSAVYTDNAIANGVATTAGTPSRPRRPSFELWVSSRSRPRIVAPNGTTIISFQPRDANSQHQLRPYQSSEVNTQITPATTPANHPRTSSPNATSPISREYSPSFPQQITTSTIPSTPVDSAALSPASTPPKSRGKTSDDIARRMIFAGIGAGRVPKRTEEELKKRQEDQERRRVQREEREKLGKDEMMKWSGIQAVKSDLKPAGCMIVNQDLIQPEAAIASANELTRFNGEDIKW